MEILQALEQIRNPFLTNLFRIFTALGEHLVIIAVICAIYWCWNKKLAYRITFGLFASSLFVQALKITFQIPRPWVRYPQLHPITDAMDTATGYSFPSGHTQASSALYGMLACSTKHWGKRIACILMIIGVGFSRMYLGMHTLQDVLTSMVITLAITGLVYRVSHIEFTKKKRLMVSIVIATCSVAVLLYSLFLRNSGAIATEFAADSCEAAFAGLGLAIGWYIESCYIQFNEQTTHAGLQIVKYLIGIGITIGLKLIMKAILPDGIIQDGMANLILVLWILIGYPLMIKKIFQKTGD